jgi:hypothetical protein
MKDTTYKAICIFIMVISSILIIRDLFVESEYRWSNIMTHVCMFFIGPLYYYIYRRSKIKKERNTQNADGEALEKKSNRED